MKLKTFIDDFIVSEGCSSENNKHILKSTQSPYFRECEVCYKKFYLIEESVFDKLNIKTMVRPIKEQ